MCPFSTFSQLALSPLSSPFSSFRRAVVSGLVVQGPSTSLCARFAILVNADCGFRHIRTENHDGRIQHQPQDEFEFGSDPNFTFNIDMVISTASRTTVQYTASPAVQPTSSSTSGPSAEHAVPPSPALTPGSAGPSTIPAPPSSPPVDVPAPASPLFNFTAWEKEQDKQAALDKKNGKKVQEPKKKQGGKKKGKQDQVDESSSSTTSKQMNRFIRFRTFLGRRLKNSTKASERNLQQPIISKIGGKVWCSILTQIKEHQEEVKRNPQALPDFLVDLSSETETATVLVKKELAEARAKKKKEMQERGLEYDEDEEEEEGEDDDDAAAKKPKKRKKKAGKPKKTTTRRQRKGKAAVPEEVEAEVEDTRPAKRQRRGRQRPSTASASSSAPTGTMSLANTPSTSASGAVNPPRIDFDSPATDPPVQGVDPQWGPAYEPSARPVPRPTPLGQWDPPFLPSAGPVSGHPSNLHQWGLPPMVPRQPQSFQNPQFQYHFQYPVSANMQYSHGLAMAQQQMARRANVHGYPSQGYGYPAGQENVPMHGPSYQIPDPLSWGQNFSQMGAVCPTPAQQHGDWGFNAPVDNGLGFWNDAMLSSNVDMGMGTEMGMGMPSTADMGMGVDMGMGMDMGMDMGMNMGVNMGMDMGMDMALQGGAESAALPDMTNIDAMARFLQEQPVHMAFPDVGGFLPEMDLAAGGADGMEGSECHDSELDGEGSPAGSPQFDASYYPDDEQHTPEYQ